MRARNIKPGFFVSDQVAENSYEGRLLFIGLWLMADCNGNLENRPKKMKAIIFPFDNIEIEPLLINLDKSGLIRTYTVQGQSYINIPKFLKHQTPHKNERETGGKFPDYTSEAEEPHSIAESRIIQNNLDKSRKNQSNPADLLNPDLLNPDLLNPDLLNPDLLKEDTPPERPKVSPEQIAELFPKTKISKTVPKLNDQRRKHIKARIKEDAERNDIKFWDDYFTKVSEIGFLHGNNDRGWIASFDWLINSTNMLKVLEGNYADGQQTTQANKKPTRPMMTEKEQNSCPHFFEFLQKKITLAEVTRRTGKFFPDDQYLRCDGKPYSEEPDGECIEIEAEEEEETESIFSKGFGVLDLSGKMPF